MATKLDYHASVDYALADPVKVLAQKEGLATSGNMPLGMSELPGTRGESAYVFRMGQTYGAFVQEGLGTKSLIAQDIYKKTGKSHFAAIAKDTVACIINDLVSVGARPVVLNAYWSSNSYKWLSDKKLAIDFIKGWRDACDEASVVWGGGETQSLSGIIKDGVIEFAGSAFGVIEDEKKLVQGSKLCAGDSIVFIESSGVHANGISLIREMAQSLPDGYDTPLDNSRNLGEAVLVPSHIYAKLVLDMQAKNINIHYLSNITGHGWRKLMRAAADFTYVIDTPGTAPLIFDFIKNQTSNSLEEMYSNYNMGAGLAVYIDKTEVNKVLEVASDVGLKAWEAGRVKSGEKQVIIEPLDITFSGSSLEVR